MDTYIAIVESKYEKTDVVHALGSLGEMAELFENAFLVKSRYTASDIRDELYDSLDGSPKIYVSKLARGSAWKNTGASSVEIRLFYSNGED